MILFTRDLVEAMPTHILAMAEAIPIYPNREEDSRWVNPWDAVSAGKCR